MRQGPKQPMERGNGRVLLRRRPAGESPLFAADLQLDLPACRDGLLDRAPPQATAPVGHLACHVDRKGDAAPFQYRVGPLEIVAVAVVEGDTDESTAGVAASKPRVHLVEPDRLQVHPPKGQERGLEKPGRHLQCPRGLKRLSPRGTYVMQGQNGADAAAPRTKHVVRPGKVQRLQPRPNDRSSNLHRSLAGTLV